MNNNSQIIENKGFTLIELLVVISIIAILAGLTFPILNYAIGHSRQISCINNQKQLATGVIKFSDDSNGCLPGNNYDWDNKDPLRTDWLRGDIDYYSLNGADPDKVAPKNGTLFSYTGNEKGVYLCPSVSAGDWKDPNSGNGMFDYSMVGIFTGCSINRYPKVTRYKNNSTYIDDVPISLFIEEDGVSINDSRDGYFCWLDEISARHNDKSVMSSVDGSVKAQNLPIKNMKAGYFQSQRRNGTYESWQYLYKKFGFWKN